MSNYEDRTVDILALMGGTLGKTADLVPGLVTDGGAVCTGIQKLIQRWLILFFTPVGSNKFHPKRGCRFMSEIYSCTTESSVMTTCLFAEDAIKEQLIAEETEDMPLDERYESASFSDISIAFGGVSISVKITSRAGTTRNVILPVYSNPIAI